MRKRLRPLALQATAAERAAKLVEELARIHAAIATHDLARLAERRAGGELRRGREADARAAVEQQLERLLAARTAAEEELTDAAGAREAATAALYRLRAGSERLGLRRESAQTLHAQLSADHEAAAGYDPSRSDELAARARAAAAAAQEAARERARLELDAEERWAAVAALERAGQAAIGERLEQLARERAVVEAELVGGGRNALLALRDAAQRLGLRQESNGRLGDDLRRELAEAASLRTTGPAPAELGAVADEADAAARAAARERDDLAARAALAAERRAALERSLAEREGLPPAARELAERGERLALSLLDVPPGEERAVAAALGRLASAIVSDDPAHALALLEHARSGGLGSLVVLVGRDPRALVESLPVVEREVLLDSSVPAVTREGLGWDPLRGELWFAGETAEAVLLELEGRRREVGEEADRLSEAAAESARAATAAAERAERAAAAFAPVAHLRSVRRRDPALLERIAAAAERLDETLRVAAAAAGRLEQPLAARAAGAAADLTAISAGETALRREAAEVDARVRAAERRAGDRRASAGDGPMPPPEGVERLRSDAEAASQAAAAAAEPAVAAAERAAAAARALTEAEGALGRRVSAVLLERLAGQALRLVAALAVEVERFETPLRARVEADAARTAELGAELRRLGADEVELRSAAAAAAERLSAIDVELARTDAEHEEAQRRLEAAGAEPAEGEDRDELAVRAERLERRRQQLGQVNPLAKEEYEAEKERLEELVAQRADLQRSLDELETLRRELTETVEQRFAETFDAVQRHFHAVAATLFPGGEGRLRLTEPEDEGEEPGIEVELRPAGKRVTRLSLLSGGEKALGAIAFLFSLFLARPSPFYLLDEVEAALDDANIGRFTSLLRTYADRAQFIVITHQKRTMEAADVLYGVTMGPDGVSQLVSRRLPREREEAASA